MAKAAKKAAKKKAAAKTTKARRAVKAPKVAKARKAAKTRAKPAAKAARAPRVPQQQVEYAKGVEQFNARRFAKATAHLRKALEGNDAALRHRAEVYLRICEKQTAAAPKLKTPEEHYTYAVALINERELDDAEQHLDAALKRQKSGAHLHYAKAVVAALRGEATPAFQHLKEAIALDPQNRILARKDADLEAVAQDERIRGLLDDQADEA